MDGATQRMRLDAPCRNQGLGIDGLAFGPVVTRPREDWQVATKSGSPYTFPSDEPDREIDFVMIRPSDALEVLEHRVVPETMAADHPSSPDGP